MTEVPLICANAVLDNLPVRWLADSGFRFNDTPRSGFWRSVYDSLGECATHRDNGTVESAALRDAAYSLWQTCRRQRLKSPKAWHYSQEFAALWQFQIAAVTSEVLGEAAIAGLEFAEARNRL